MEVINGAAVTSFDAPTTPQDPHASGVLLACRYGEESYGSAAGHELTTIDGMIVRASGPTGFNGAMEFDGTSDYITAPNSSDFDFGTKDFTIDAFIYLDNLSETPQYFVTHFEDVNNRWVLLWSSTDGIRFFNNDGGSQTLVDQGSTSGWVASTWYHLALVRSNSTVTIYRNGTSIGSGTLSGNIDHTGTLYIGQRGTTEDYLNGRLANLRISNGIARWTSNFTPPTGPYELGIPPASNLITNDGYTKLYTQLVGDLVGSHAITLNGGVTLSYDSPYERKYSQGSWKFDGTNEYASISTHSDFDFGGGDFAIRFWMKTTDKTTARNIYNKFTATGGEDGVTVNYNTSGRVGIEASDGGSRSYRYGTTDCADGAWHYVACVRDSNGLRVYVDGAEETYSSSSSPLIIRNVTNSEPVWIGYGVAGVGGAYFNGHICDIEVIKGDAVYTGNFSRPDRTQDLHTSAVLLACRQGESSYGSSASTHDLTTVDGMVLNTTGPTGFDGAMEFDGSADYMTIPNSDDWDILSGDFTIDGFFYFDSATTQMYFVNQYQDGSNYWVFEYKNDTAWQLSFGRVGSGGSLLYANWQPTTSTWYHIAATRSGNHLRIFVDGVLIDDDESFSDTTTLDGTLQIGRWGGNSRYYDGRMSNLRISKGIARWTSNFTPPTRPYEVYIHDDGQLVAGSGTALLLHMESSGAVGNFITTPDDSTAAQFVMVSGDAEIGSDGYFGNGALYVPSGAAQFSGLRINGGDSLQPGSGDFTLEMFVKMPRLYADVFGLCYNGDADGSRYAFRLGLTKVGAIDGYPTFDGYYDQTFQYGVNSVAGAAIQPDEWTHIAVVRSGDYQKTFCNGVGGESGVYPGGSGIIPSADPEQMFYLGYKWNTGADEGFDGYMDEVRYTIGTPLYWNDFTPPTPTPSGELHVYNPPFMTYGIGNVAYQRSGGNFSGVITAINFQKIYEGQWSEGSPDKIYGEMINDGGEYTIKFYADSARTYQIGEYSSNNSTGNSITFDGIKAGVGASGSFDYDMES